MLPDDPFPIGDPAGMRAMAARLRLQADRIESLSRSVIDRVAGLGFRGPKAERFRDSVHDNTSDARAISNALISASDTLLRSAADVEAQQNAWYVRRARMLEGQV